MFYRLVQSNLSQAIQVLSQFLIIYLLTTEVGTEGYSYYIQALTWISLISIASIGPISTILLKRSFFSGFNLKESLIVITKLRVVFSLFSVFIAMYLGNEIYIFLAIIVANVNLWTGNAISLLNYVKKNKLGIWVSLCSRFGVILCMIFCFSYFNDYIYILSFVIFSLILVILIKKQSFESDKVIIKENISKKSYFDIWVGQCCENISQRIEYLLAPVFLSSLTFSTLIPVYSFFLSLTIPITMFFKFLATEVIFKFKNGHGTLKFLLVGMLFNFLISNSFYFLVYYFAHLFIGEIYVGVDADKFDDYLLLLWPAFVFFCSSRFLFPIVLNATKDNSSYRNLNIINCIAAIIIYTVMLMINSSAESFIFSFTILNLFTFIIYFKKVYGMIR
ncbi:membrane hypothetical protein [Vibrio crassostreae]|uniref:hypothetical protein n=1 Tax=Vibrio crassostreae TaxID=246167 RepID=UPI001BD42320|nr:hypothetical protein [Vibrio crassostreae]CAK2194632.1 membrane hypothetical protein [Vibrio crassostreae]CAK2230739.1 membrane hypothetical protein [Vibrio crassostreae]CAK2231446.1 membrane hypothetical protein [Vibrio crassostreae]CAK2276770.1 membrane hypothetical protein [Vibrio crassostreae]CAK2277785.1 membrane hypothetical protein [Vibrio crassostreae]